MPLMFAVQEERLHDLQARVQVPYDGDDPAHQVGGLHTWCPHARGLKSLPASRVCQADARSRTAGHSVRQDSLPLSAWRGNFAGWLCRVSAGVTKTSTHPPHLSDADESPALQQDALRQLWAAAFPDEPCASLRTERWKEMGWQARSAPACWC